MACLPGRNRGEGKKLSALARAIAEDGQSDAPQPDPNNPWTAHLQALGAFNREAHAKEVYLWPDNLPAWGAWQAVQTQWRVGMGGATGLDYTGVRAWLDEQGSAGPERRELFAGIQACERATLEVWAEAREREQNQPKGPPVPGR